MPEITVIVPVLARPHNVEPTVISIVENSETEPSILFVCSPGDDAEVEELHRVGASEWRRLSGSGLSYLIAGWAPGPGDYARKINAGYRQVEEGVLGVKTPFVFLAADDLRFHRGWDTVALGFAEDHDAGVVGTEDLWNPEVNLGRHSTHSLVRCSYVREHGASWDGPGCVYHEGYDHQCVDLELVARAQQAGRWVFGWGCVVEHLHPMAGKAQRDFTYDKGMLRGQEDVMLWRERSKLHGWTP